MDLLWIYYGFIMGLLWIYYGLLWVYYGFIKVIFTKTAYNGGFMERLFKTHNIHPSESLDGLWDFKVGRYDQNPTMGVEKGIFTLYDSPQMVEKYFAALHESQMRLIDLINKSPINIINFGDNIHCGTSTPNLFIKYVLPCYQKRCEKLHSKGKFISSHWDGDTKALLPLAKETGLDGIEAVTPVPQGDVTIEEIKEHLGDDLFLLDGIPAILFDEIFPVEDLINITKKIIELFAPKLILGISDEISSTGDIERIRIVGDIVDEYNNGIK